jgi:4-amino-4-deoxy-L-arabinose transferase-like glycosyltransferase
MLIRAARVTDSGETGGAEERDAPSAGRLELAVAILIALIVAAQWAGPTLLALDRGIYGGDSLWYHMPLAAHIAQTGSVTSLLYTDPLYLNWFYPQVSELLHAGGLLLFGNDFLSPLINMAWLGLALFAGWCVGRPYGSGATSLAAVASVMAANLLFSRQPGNANNDVVGIALFLSAVALLVNARWERAGPPFGALLVAGLAAGLALGTKLTVVPPVLALTVGVIVISGRGSRLRASAGWIGGLVVGGGYWYARNLVVSGNPFPWQDIGPIHHAEALQGRHPYAIVHYATDTDVWGRYFTPALHERLGDLWPAYLALAVIAVVLVLWRGGRIERMLGAVALLSAIAYLLTPLGASGPEGMPVGFRLNIRYLAPGLVLALTLLAIPPFRGERGFWRLGSLQRLWRFATLAIFAVLVVVSAGAIGAIDTGRLPGTAALALTVVALPLLLVFLSRRGLAAVALAGIGAAAVIALAVFGRFAQDHYLDERYSSSAPDYPKTEQPATELGQGLGAAYDWARSTHDLKIALSGTMGALFQYGLWGWDSSNDVRYVGEKGPRGSFNEIRQCPEWIAALNDADYDYVITTPTYHQDDPAADTAPIQRRWIARAGNVQRVAGANLVDVWRVTGPLDPLACVAPAGAAQPSATGT